jgi:hypothetical protein
MLYVLKQANEQLRRMAFESKTLVPI